MSGWRNNTVMRMFVAEWGSGQLSGLPVDTAWQIKGSPRRCNSPTNPSAAMENIQVGRTADRGFRFGVLLAQSPTHPVDPLLFM